MICITTGKVSDVSMLDKLCLPKGSIVVLDRGYIDFKRLYKLVHDQCSFVVRARSDLLFNCTEAHGVDIKSGVHSDQTVVLMGQKSKKSYPQALRRVRFFS